MKLWIARDKDGYLKLCEVEPMKGVEEYFTPGYNGEIPLAKDMFPEITFENSPQEVELNIKSK